MSFDLDPLTETLSKICNCHHYLFLNTVDIEETLKIYKPLLKVIDCRSISELKTLIYFFNLQSDCLVTSDGILIDCMKKGIPLLFKNIDSNLKIFYFLKSAIENNKILVFESMIQAKTNFQLFFTSNVSLKCNNLIVLKPQKLTYYNILNNKKLTMEKYVKKILVKFFEHYLEYDLEQLNDEIIIKFKMFFSLNLSTRIDLYRAITVIFFSEIETKRKDEIFKELVEDLYLTTDEINSKFVINSSSFVQTSVVQSIFNDIVYCIKNNLPVQLVGETGTGKTAIIQYLAENAHTIFGNQIKLRIINCSNDTDFGEFIGFYHNFENKHLSYLRSIYGFDIMDDFEFLLFVKQSNVSNNIMLRAEKALQNLKQRYVFQEGILYNALVNGEWILFDEVNLAPKESLDFLNSLIENKFFYVFEKGSINPILFHSNTRIFMCMNPSTDVNKKEFYSPYFIRINYPDYSSNLDDIKQITYFYMKLYNNKVLENIYECLVNQDNNFYNSINIALSEFYFEVRLSIEEYKIIGFQGKPLISGRTYIRFLNLLRSCGLTEAIKLIFYTQIEFNSIVHLNSISEKYFNLNNNNRLKIFKSTSNFIVTATNLNNIRLIDIAIKNNFPVLLQGPTSTGKTAFIHYLGLIKNKKIYRINCHANIDSSDYIGNYIIDTKGYIKFVNGILVKAMKAGDWILLDELNLAKSDVLETLNRLLDDNKEILVNGEMVKASLEFCIFATQNLNYYGRKRLSKALRNRFVEFTFDKLTLDEIKVMLKGLNIPNSFITKIIEVYHFLSIDRSFKHVITLRDAFKWAKRPSCDLFNLYINGMSLFYEKQRDEVDKKHVCEVFENVFKYKIEEYNKLIKSKLCLKKSLAKNNLITNKEFKQKDINNFVLSKNLNNSLNDCLTTDSEFFFTKSYIKLFNLAIKAIKNKENVLIVGETGLGKTKVVELISKIKSTKLITMSLHADIETSDFVGTYVIPFKWKDGPLIKAMKEGNYFLLDEINLADGSVIERLNSVLENEREIFINETDTIVKANDNFIFFACMNPGNDFGKKELSPALRNRFTEIYFDVSFEEKMEIFRLSLIKKIKDYNVALYFYLKYVAQLNLNADISIRKLMDDVDRMHNLLYGKFFDIKYCNELTKENVYSALFLNNNKNNTGWDYLNKNYDDYSYGMEQNCFLVGVHPFYIETSKHIPFALSLNARKNVLSVLKSMILNKGILLVGPPGSGKTSFIAILGKILCKKIVRINLSQETEMCDLCGSYVPKYIHNELKIEFKKTEFIKALENSMWVVLDEINLANQSVLEGLNSALDYRREIYLDKTYKLGKEARIFATMNEFELKSGRKELPKSFLDRFTIVKMIDYTDEDIEFIINELISFWKQKDYQKLFKNNIFNLSYNLWENKNDGQFIKKLHTYTIIKKDSLRKSIFASMLNLHEEDLIRYNYEDTIFSIGNHYDQLKFCCLLRLNYVITHSNVKNLYIALKCFLFNIPIVVTGKYGKSAFIEFISTICNMELCDINCFEETDINDLLGFYDVLNNKITWRNSFLVNFLKKKNKIIKFDGVDKINNAIFDRLNGLFEEERILYLHEKGDNEVIKVDSTIKLVIECNDINNLSHAILDRCWIIELSNEINIIDAIKIKNKTGNNFKIDICDEKITENFKNKYCYTMKLNLNLFNVIRDYTSTCFSNNQFYDDYNNDLIVTDKNKQNKIITNEDTTIECFDINFYKNLQNNYFFQNGFCNNFNDKEIFEIIDFLMEDFAYTEFEVNLMNMDNFDIFCNFYEKITYNIAREAEDFEKIRSFEKYDEKYCKAVNFMKNSKLSFMEKQPSNYDYFCYEFILHLKTLPIKDYWSIKEMCKTLQNFHFKDNNVIFEQFYFTFLMFIFDEKIDPLLFIKIKLLKEIRDKFNALLDKLKIEFVKLYKYGISEIEDKLTVLLNFKANYLVALKDINLGLERNFNFYVKNAKEKYLKNCFFGDYKFNFNLQDNICEWPTNYQKEAIYFILNELAEFSCFDDFTDYRYIELFIKNYKIDFVEKNTLFYLYVISNTLDRSDYFKFLSIVKKYNIELNPKFSENFITRCNIFNEMIFLENKKFVFEIEDSWWLDEKYVENNDIFKIIFKNLFMKNFVFMLPYNKTLSYISITDDFIWFLNKNKHNDDFLIDKILDNDLFSKQEDLIMEYKDFLLYYQNAQKILGFNYNYSWFLLLIIMDLTREKITEYLLNSKIYQYLERDYFIELLINNNNLFNVSKSNINLLYNISLQYRGFEIEKKMIKIRQVKEKKVWYNFDEFSAYKKILDEETINLISEVEINECEFFCDCYKNILNEKLIKNINCETAFNTSSDINTTIGEDKNNMENNFTKIITLKDSLLKSYDYQEKQTSVNNASDIPEVPIINKHNSEAFIDDNNKGVIQSTNVHITENKEIHNQIINKNLIILDKVVNIPSCTDIDKKCKKIKENDEIQNKHTINEKNKELFSNMLKTSETLVNDAKSINNCCYWSDFQLKNYKADKRYDVADKFYNRDVINKYTNKEILLSKVFNEYINIMNSIEAKFLCLIEYFLCLFINYNLCPNFLKAIKIYICENKKYEEFNTGDGMKMGTGDKNISEGVGKNEKFEDEGLDLDKNTCEESNGVELENEGEFFDKENEDGNDAEEKGCTDKDEIADKNNDNAKEDVFENAQENKDRVEAQEDDCQMKIEEDYQSEKNTSEVIDEINLNSNETENSFANEEDLEISDLLNDKVIDDFNNVQIEKYKMDEGQINFEQTCEKAENYNKFIEGKNEDIKVLNQGLGDECINDLGDELGEFDNKIYQHKLPTLKCSKVEHKNMFVLANELKFILRENKKNKYIGNYKNGKKLNLKRIISFIVSNYKKDKIWLRRTKAEKREYLVRIFLDTSKSMQDNIILEHLLTVFKDVCGALDLLEIEYELYGFGSKVKRYDSLTDFTKTLSFDETQSNLMWTKDFNDGINLILTDGVFQIPSCIANNFLALLFGKEKLAVLKQICIIDDEFVYKRYLDTLNIRYCLVEEDRLERGFYESLKEMLMDEIDD